jgi:hypothetical protein
MASLPAPSEPPVPWTFVIVSIVVAVVVAVIIAYLGLTGQIGAGITGAKPPSGGLVILPLTTVAFGISDRVRTRRGP